MNCVLVTLSGGIISDVDFFVDVSKAVQSLSEYVRAMNHEKHDAAVYGPQGMIANAKNFLDENDQYHESILKEF